MKAVNNLLKAIIFTALALELASCGGGGGNSDNGGTAGGEGVGTDKIPELRWKKMEFSSSDVARFYFPDETNVTIQRGTGHEFRGTYSQNGKDLKIFNGTAATSEDVVRYEGTIVSYTATSSATGTGTYACKEFFTNGLTGKQTEKDLSLRFTLSDKN